MKFIIIKVIRFPKTCQIALVGVIYFYTRLDDSSEPWNYFSGQLRPVSQIRNCSRLLDPLAAFLSSS